MSTPISLKNIPYKVAGASTYIGDLIITEKLIYYLPQKELAAQIYKIGYLSYVFVGILVVLFTPLVLLREGLKGAVEHQLKEHFVNPSTYEGQQQRKEAEEMKEWLIRLEKSYPTPEIIPEYLYPTILYSALWYPLVLDSIVAEICESRSISSDSIPKPERFSMDKIKKISLTWVGSLIIETDYDMKHKFRVGVTKKSLLRKTLANWGYMS